MNPHILGIIPARGGSRRVARKNVVSVGGKPLIAHSIGHLASARRVSRVVVSTDDAEVADLSRQAGAEVVVRPPELATDEASSELALINVLDVLERRDGYSPRLVVFLQATSPVRRLDEIDNAVAQFESENADSLFSACLSNKLIWRAAQKQPTPLNYDFRARRREQDFPAEFRENGSIYVFSPNLLRREGSRLGGRISVYLMPEWASFQLDEPWEVSLIDWILARQHLFESET